MIVTIINGFFILWLYRTYMFLDKGLLKKKFTLFLAILYIAKFLLVVLYPLLSENMSAVVFVLLNVIGIYSILDYVRNFPITNSHLSRFCISIICAFQNLCLIFTLFEYTQLIEEPSLFYVLVFSIVFSIKIGLKIHETIYHRMLKSDMDDHLFLGYCLEELYRLYNARHSCTKDSFFLGGVMKLHVVKCTYPKCVVTEKTLNEFDFMDLEIQQKLMNNFISQIFLKNLKAINMKHSTNAQNFERIVLKFSSFLNKNNSSPMKAYYEIQKIFSLNIHKSFYFQSISMNVLRQIRALIILFENTSHKNVDFIENDKELEVSTFFEMFNEKHSLKKIFLDLLEKRLIFWDKYKDGFHSYEEVLKVMNKFMNEVVNVRKILDQKMSKNKSSQKIIFDLKFKTILECVIFNNVNNAVKNEGELDKIKKKELTLEKNILNCNSFFNNNYTTILASFLNCKGKILENSKKESLARFFNYSMEEVKSLIEINSLMPSFLATNHSRFIDWFLKKDRTAKSKEKKFIPSFGLNKQGFIFPIKLYIGFNFDFSYDVVFHAAMLDLGRREEQILIFDEEGKILGLTKEFYRFFNVDVGGFKIDLMMLMNIFSFVPNLNSILKKSKVFEDITVSTLINQICQIYFPQNIEEILKIFAIKLKEEAEEKNLSKASYSKSVISFKSNKNKSIKSYQTNSSNKKSATNKSKTMQFLSKFLQAWNTTADEKMEIERKFHDKEITNAELLELLIDKQTCRRHKMNFNLNIIRNYYSNKECITYCQLTINRISKDLKELALNQSANNNKFDTFYDPKATATVLQKSDIVDRISDLEMEPFQREEDDVKSSFVILPEVNQTTFKEKNKKPEEKQEKQEKEKKEEKEEKDNNYKRLVTEDNRLLTTENDVLPSPEEEKKITESKKTIHLEESFKIVNTPAENTKTLPFSKIEGKKIIKTPPPESFVNTSEHNSGLIKQKNLGLNTSNQRVVDALDHSSQKSSITNVKKTFTVFAIINMIQRNFPSCLKSFTLSQIVELMIVISYCISMYVLSVQYIDNYYNPLNEAVLNFAKMYNAYSCTNLVTVEYEYAIYNYSNYQNGYTYNAEFKTIISNSFQDLKDLSNEERAKPTQFSYQTLFKSVAIMASDPNLPKMDQFIYVDFLDSIIDQLYELQNTDYANMALWKLEYFSINYINFLNIYQLISESLDAEFFQTNSLIANALQIIMILFVLLIFLLKFFEYCQLELYYRKMIRILNIFLRVNQKEAFGEYFLTKDIHTVLSDPMDAFLNYNYIEKVLMKRDNKKFEFEEEDGNRSKSPTKNKNAEKKTNFRKKLSFQDLKPISLWHLLSFICFFGALVLLYIGLNYYYFILINEEVTNLINITLFFEKIYTLPTTVLMINRVILRERVITNQLYNFPDPIQRQIDLNNLLNKYVDDLSSTTPYISSYSLGAIQNIQQSDFPFILYGDACNALIMNNLINETEINQCQTTLNTAFQKGLLSIVTEILTGINEDGEFRVIYNDTASIELQKQGILKRLAENIGVDRVTADYYLNKLLMLFYNDLENYYRDQMLGEINNLKIVILITTIFLGVILIAVIWYRKKYYESTYTNISLTLNLIPYEKLLNDEQTLFLIKKFWRE